MSWYTLSSMTAAANRDLLLHHGSSSPSPTLSGSRRISVHHIGGRQGRDEKFGAGKTGMMLAPDSLHGSRIGWIRVTDTVSLVAANGPREKERGCWQRSPWRRDSALSGR